MIISLNKFMDTTTATAEKNNPREIKKIQLAVPFGHPVAFRSEFFKYNQACLNAIMAVAPDFKRFLIS